MATLESGEVAPGLQCSLRPQRSDRELLHGPGASPAAGTLERLLHSAGLALGLPDHGGRWDPLWLGCAGPPFLGTFTTSLSRPVLPSIHMFTRKVALVSILLVVTGRFSSSS